MNGSPDNPNEIPKLEKGVPELVNPELPRKKPSIELSPQQEKDLVPDLPMSEMDSDEVDVWVKQQNPKQRPQKEKAILLSTAQRVFNRHQIDYLRPTIYKTPSSGTAPAIVFRYWDDAKGVGETIVIILNRRADAPMLTRAIAWSRIWDYPFGEWVRDVDEAALKYLPSFKHEECRDEYFKEVWKDGIQTALDKHFNFQYASLKQNYEAQLMELKKNISGLEATTMTLHKTLNLKDNEIAGLKGRMEQWQMSDMKDFWFRTLLGVVLGAFLTACAWVVVWITHSPK
jgi:hypothetical protein